MIENMGGKFSADWMAIHILHIELDRVSMTVTKSKPPLCGSDGFTEIGISLIDL